MVVASYRGRGSRWRLGGVKSSSVLQSATVWGALGESASSAGEREEARGRSGERERDEECGPLDAPADGALVLGWGIRYMFWW